MELELELDVSAFAPSLKLAGMPTTAAAIIGALHHPNLNHNNNHITSDKTHHTPSLSPQNIHTMPDSNPPPRVWCLRFKLNRTTVVLHIDALQTLASIRSELLEALRATHPDGIFKGTLRDGTPVSYPLPANPEDIALAKQADPHDPNAGWEAIGDDAEEGLIFDEDVKGKGKGKGRASAAPSRKSASSAKDVNDCPQGAGLKDGSIVAFRFRLAEEKARRQRLIDGELDVDEIARDGMGDDADWDVVMPTMEETYDDEDAAEMG
jgi:hypothetical protein